MKSANRKGANTATANTTTANTICYHQEVYCRPNGKEYAAKPKNLKVKAGDTFRIKAPRNTVIRWLTQNKPHPFTEPGVEKTVDGDGIAEFTVKTGVAGKYEYEAEIPFCGIKTSDGPPDRPSMEVG